MGILGIINKIDKYLLLLSFVIMYTVPIYWLARGAVKSETSIIESRKLSVFPKLSGQKFTKGVKSVLSGQFSEAEKIFFGQFINRKYQSNFESASSDQFPFRIPALQIVKATDRFIINIAYGLLNDPAVPVDLRSEYYYKMRAEDTFFHSPTQYTNQNMELAVDRRVKNYTELITTFPDIDFYVFALPTLHHTEFHPLNKYFNDFAGDREIDYFITTKPQLLNFSTLHFSSYKDYFQSFYRTDHHWNVYGSLRGYETIYKMISINYPEISPMVTPKEIFTFPDIEFLGSTARTSLYPVKGDKFEVALFDLPPHQTLVNGKEVTYGQSENYLLGIYSHEPYINHYDKFYGGTSNFIEYIFNNESNRNLLIIGNSYKTPIQQLIASHYNHTFSVDLGFYKNFSLSEFIKKYPVDDILILGDYNLAFLSKSWIIKP